jgi:hypothetical protein
MVTIQNKKREPEKTSYIAPIKAVSTLLQHGAPTEKAPRENARRFPIKGSTDPNQRST